jgi:hypothetical protein
MGFTLRSVPLPAGFRGVSAGKNPRTVYPARSPAPKCRTGLAGRGFWVLTFRKCLASAGFLSRRTLGSSLGFHPSRAIPREPCTGISPGLLSRASQTREQDARINLTACTESTGAPESRSALAWLSPDVHRSARRKKLPSWGLCTCPYPDRSDFAPPGLLSSPCTGPRITVDSPVRFGR